MADRRYTEPKCSFKLVDGHVETDGTVKNKITGTNLGALLGLSPFTTPFQAACAMLGVGREILDGKQSVELGKYLEDKLIDYCANVHQDIGTFLKAEEVFGKREGDHDDWSSDWEDEHFAGHLDGVVVADDGNYVLEVKTTSNIAAWEDGVPQHYALQVALYNHFMYHQPKAYVILGIVDDETRKDVSKWTPSEDNVMLFSPDMTLIDMDEVIKAAREWYSAYIEQGITPEYDPTNPRDVELWAHLTAISATSDEIQKDLDRLEVIRAELDDLSKRTGPLEEEEKALEGKIKDYMIGAHKLEIVSSSKLMRGVVTRSERTRIDKKLLLNAGIDPTPYTVTTVVQSFSFKPVKTETASIETKEE